MSSNSNNSNNSNDPSNFLSNPTSPTTVVKVVNTARDDMNGQLGVVTAYNQERNRYIVHMTASQSSTALKPSNLQLGSFLEKITANYQQLRNDRNLKRQLTQVYDVVQHRLTAAKYVPSAVKPEHVAGALLLVLIGCFVVVGFTKMLTLLTLVLLIGTIIAPDIMATTTTSSSSSASPFRTIATNFPNRCREAIEQNIPQARGRISNRVAAGIVLLFVVFLGRGLVQNPTSRARRDRTAATATSAAGGTTMSSETMYQLGFEDATNGKVYGTSLPHQQRRAASDPEEDGTTDPADLSDPYTSPNSELMYDYIPPSPQKQTKFGFGTIMSGFVLVRTAAELGGNAAAAGGGGGGIMGNIRSFDSQRMIANAKTMETWKMGLLGFSVYNVLKAFV